MEKISFNELEYDNYLLEDNKLSIELKYEEKQKLLNSTYIFTTNWFTFNKPNWDQFFNTNYPIANENSLNKILELGSWQGQSSCYIINNLLKNKDSELICMDMFQYCETHFNGMIDMDTKKTNLNKIYNIFCHNITLTGKKDQVKIIRGSTLEELPKMNMKYNEYFNFIYIDASHTAKDVLIDALNSFCLLKVGGIIIFDDYSWGTSENNDKIELDNLLRPKHGIDTFIEFYKDYINVIFKCNQLYIIKIKSSSESYEVIKSKIVKCSFTNNGFFINTYTNSNEYIWKPNVTNWIRLNSNSDTTFIDINCNITKNNSELDLNLIDTKNIIIKINTEGYELETLKGMNNILSDRRISQIIIELNPIINEINKLVECISIIKSYGFLNAKLLFNSNNIIDEDNNINDVGIMMKLDSYHIIEIVLIRELKPIKNDIIVNIFILCFNESIMLPHTIKYYKKCLPNCKITIYDNESTDNSVEIAKSLGCDVISFSSNNGQNESIQREIKNNCWNHVKNGWIIMIDMDEWLCITEEDLYYEESKGTTILKIKGVNMIGESNSLLLDDIDLNSINKAIDDPTEDKSLCFKKDSIIFMNYSCGAHTANPCGIKLFSSKVYINKHMNYLGLPFIINKILIRYERTFKIIGDSISKFSLYINDENIIREKYNKMLSESYLLNE